MLRVECREKEQVTWKGWVKNTTRITNTKRGGKKSKNYLVQQMAGGYDSDIDIDKYS